jgi:hypothetical protein
MIERSIRTMLPQLCGVVAAVYFGIFLRWSRYELGDADPLLLFEIVVGACLFTWGIADLGRAKYYTRSLTEPVARAFSIRPIRLLEYIGRAALNWLYHLRRGYPEALLAAFVLSFIATVVRLRYASPALGSYRYDNDWGLTVHFGKEAVEITVGWLTPAFGLAGVVFLRSIRSCWAVVVGAASGIWSVLVVVPTIDWDVAPLVPGIVVAVGLAFLRSVLQASWAWNRRRRRSVCGSEAS